MKSLIGSLIGLVLSVSGGAEPLLEGQVRLASGQPVAGVQVRLFDLTDLRRFVGTTTDEAGYFALPLQTFSTDRSTALPTDFALGQNYPNPFNPSTVIPYQLLSSGHVRLEVFNLLGQRLATLVDAERSAGMHTAQWDATDAAGRAVGTGVYIYRLSSGGVSVSRRMVLVDGQAGIPMAGTDPDRMKSVAPQPLAADGRVYGLTVSGQGLVAYVDPAFRVGIDPASIVVEPYEGAPRMKLAAGGVWGDVNNDGQVDLSDVLFVMLYSTDSSIMLPNNGDISLGDVNEDGRVNSADAVLLIRYLSDPLDPTLPLKIGRTKVSLGSSMSRIYWTEEIISPANPWDELIDSINLPANDHLNDYSIIRRADLDGSNVEDLVHSLPGLSGLALDVNGGQMYWSVREVCFFHPSLPSHMDYFNTSFNTSAASKALSVCMPGFIARADLDGSNVEDLVSESTACGLALDVVNGKMYWTSRSRPGIQRADLDGSNVEDLVSESTACGLALDVVNGKMYWTDSYAGAIQRADLDGSNVEDLITDLGQQPVGIALDVVNGKMYWTGSYAGKIQCSDLDGSNVEDLITGLGQPVGIALDVVNGKMYWTDSYAGAIQRADLDGSNVEDLITDLEWPAYIALAP